MAFSNSKTSGVTTETAVYTATGVTATVIGMSVAPTNVEATVDIKLGTTHVVKGLVIAAGTSAIPIGGGQKMVLLDTESLNVTSTAAVDVIVSVLEA